jgi:hypothetical protein
MAERIVVDAGMSRNDILNRMAEIAEERNRLIRKHKPAFFIPNGVQHEFMMMPQKVLDTMGPKMRRKVITYILSAANGNGKTMVLAQLARILSVGAPNHWSDVSYYRDFPRPNRGRIVSTQKALDEGLILEMKELFAGDLEEGYPKKGGKMYEAVWKVKPTEQKMGQREALDEELVWSFKDGSSFDLFTWEMAVTQFAGAMVHWLILDEPGKKGVYKECLARLRLGGPVFWGLTPYDETGGVKQDLVWLFNELQDAEEADESGHKSYHLMYSDAEDNCKEHGIRGLVPHEVIEDRYNRWTKDPDELKARFTGRFPQEEGKVFKQFSEERHVIEPVPIGPEFERFAALDHHPEKPEYYLQGAVAPDGTLYITHELIVAQAKDRTKIDRMATDIKALWALHGMPKDPIIDPLAQVTNPVVDRSPLEEYIRFGVTMRPAGPEKAEKDLGFELIKQRLVGIKDVPRIFVFKTCTRLIWEMKRLNVDPKTQKPEKENDDMCENLYRMVLNVPRMDAYQRQRTYRQLDTFVSPYVLHQ